MIVHLFPGQGDFALSPLISAVGTVPALRSALAEVFTEADRAGVEFGLTALGPRLLGRAPPSARALAAEPVGTTQLALYGVCLAIHRAMARSGAPPDRLIAVSFGEIPALVAAGCFTVADGARLACRLAQLLHSADGGLTLLRASEGQSDRLLQEVGHEDVVIACVNDPGERVLSGPIAELLDVELAAQARGMVAHRLRLPFLSHHPKLSAQAQAFASYARTLPTAPPRLPVHSAVAGSMHTADTDLPRALAACLTDPADFPPALRQAVGRATASEVALWEAGTGHALTDNARRTLPTVNARAPFTSPGSPATPGTRGFPWSAGLSSPQPRPRPSGGTT
ncbi:ACP S-malonyltransferase [Kitasatospora sp. McL0602]|uniref:ACP S-malonyltransferase n=1 Tax=Kitasatospora sp. McL0602 TaxID=3439530 RepID=UPI003F8C8001